MIKSMTGYGKSEKECEGKKISVEVKSLNSKSADLSARMPSFYRIKELAYRNKVAGILKRGKIELSIYVEKTGENQVQTINRELAQLYHKELKEVSELLGESNGHLMSQVLKMPDVMKSEVKETSEAEWAIVEEGLEEAIGQLNEFRDQEGKVLQDELALRVNNIANLLLEVEQFEGERIEKVKERIKTHLFDAIDDRKIDQDRFEQELIFYIEKYDVTEEKVRLKNHCDYFIETMEKEESQGKKLGFISQEIGREINTLGSKSNHTELQKIVVQMKDELEKIKEQALNVL